MTERMPPTPPSPPPPAKRIGPVAAFLERTFKMVDEASSNGIVTWSATGDSFIIKRVDLFEKEVIPRFFNHSNLLSFVRQLNNHGEPLLQSIML